MCLVGSVTFNTRAAGWDGPGRTRRGRGGSPGGGHEVSNLEQPRVGPWLGCSQQVRPSPHLGWHQGGGESSLDRHSVIPHKPQNCQASGNGNWWRQQLGQRLLSQTDLSPSDSYQGHLEGKNRVSRVPVTSFFLWKSLPSASQGLVQADWVCLSFSSDQSKEPQE